ncbi:hypothetical protein HK096_007562, partial [Nowakowskiella sp. JEL0078]
SIKAHAVSETVVEPSHEQSVAFGYARNSEICIAPDCNKKIRGTTDRGTRYCQTHYRKIKSHEKIYIEIEQKIKEICESDNMGDNTEDEFHRLKTQKILLQLELYKNYHGVIDSDLFPTYYSLDPNCIISAKCSNCEKDVLHEYPLCKYCSRLLHRIDVRKSTIQNAGLGLFAWSPINVTLSQIDLSKEVVFRRGDYISYNLIYGGDELNQDDFQEIQQESVSAYLFQVSRNRFKDGSKTNAGILRYINENRNKRFYNCRFVSTLIERKVEIKAKTLKDILDGEELFICYNDPLFTKTLK